MLQIEILLPGYKDDHIKKSKLFRNDTSELKLLSG